MSSQNVVVVYFDLTPSQMQITKQIMFLALLCHSTNNNISSACETLRIRRGVAVVPLIFRVVTWQHWMPSYLRFETACRSHLKGSKCPLRLKKRGISKSSAFNSKAHDTSHLTSIWDSDVLVNSTQEQPEQILPQ